MSTFISLLRRGRRLAGDAGQATVEYVLVLMAAGTIAIAALLWARGTSVITDLFESVARQMMSAIG